MTKERVRANGEGMTSEEKTLSRASNLAKVVDCQHDATILHGMLQGLEILISEAASHGVVTPASNAVGALSGEIVERAKQLSEDLGELELKQ